jgi:hypothetical protein
VVSVLLFNCYKSTLLQFIIENYRWDTFNKKTTPFRNGFNDGEAVQVCESPGYVGKITAYHYPQPSVLLISEGQSFHQDCPVRV